MTAPKGELACGCGPKAPCSLAELLLRTGEWRKLERHVEEFYDRTFLGRRRKKLVVNVSTAPKTIGATR